MSDAKGAKKDDKKAGKAPKEAGKDAKAPKAGEAPAAEVKEVAVKEKHESGPKAAMLKIKKPVAKVAADTKENANRAIRIEKLVLNICVGESGDKLTKGTLLQIHSRQGPRGSLRTKTSLLQSQIHYQKLRNQA